jgi:hypothetical protein
VTIGHFDWDVTVGEYVPEGVATCWLCWLDDVQRPGIWVKQSDGAELTMDFLSNTTVVRLCGGLSASFW